MNQAIAPKIHLSFERIIVFAAAMLILTGYAQQLVLAAPGDSTSFNSQDIPAEAPYIRGTITALREEQILVEENAAEVSGSAKANLRRTDSTRILRHTGASARPSDLKAGQQVRVWVTGPVIESYPARAVAAVIVIEP